MQFIRSDAGTLQTACLGADTGCEGGQVVRVKVFSYALPGRLIDCWWQFNVLADDGVDLNALETSKICLFWKIERSRVEMVVESMD